MSPTENMPTKYSSLAAEVRTDISDSYYDALEFALNDDTISNIAVTGPYGSGKSTILLSYFKRENMENRVLNVSLATFSDEDNFCYENIQKSIVKQLLIFNSDNEEMEGLTFTKFKLKFKKYYSRHKSAIAASYVVTVLLVIVLVLSGKFTAPIINFYEISLNFIGAVVRNSRNVISAMLVMFFFIVTIILYLLNFGFLLIFPFFIYHGIESVFSRLNISIKNMNIGDLSVQIDEKKGDIFGQFTTNIIETINIEGIDIIVFEDIDRFTHFKVKIMEDLRQLNQHIKSSVGNEKFKFIFAIEANVLNNLPKIKTVGEVSKVEHREFLEEIDSASIITKFFEFIIPVTPVVDSRNAYSHIISELYQSLEDKFSDKSGDYSKKIKVLSRYITDMRVIKHMKNDYQITLDLLRLEGEHESFVESIDPSKLLTISLLKIMYPREMALLQKNEGILAHFLDRRSVLINFNSALNVEKKSLTDKVLKETETEYNFLNEIFTLISDEFDLDVSGPFVLKVGDVSFTLKDQEENPEIVQEIIKQLNEYKKFKRFEVDLNNSKVDLSTISEEIDFEVSPNELLANNRALIRSKADLKEIDHGIDKMTEMKLDEIYNHKNYPISNNLNNLQKMITVFIREGLIDDDFHNLMSVSNKKQLPAQFNLLGLFDLGYIKRIQETSLEEYDTVINDPELMIEELGDKDIVSGYALNRSLIVSVLSRNKIKRENNRDNKYINNWMSSEKFEVRLKELIIEGYLVRDRYIYQRMVDINSFVFAEMISNYDEIILDDILQYSGSTIFSNNEFYFYFVSYINEYKNSSLSDLKFLGVRQLLSLVQSLEMKFVDVNFTDFDLTFDGVKRKIIETQAYSINYFNVKDAVSFVEGVECEPIFEKIMKNSDIEKYIVENIENYIELVYIDQKLWKLESKGSILSLINISTKEDVVEEKLIEEIVKNQKDRFDFVEVENNKYWDCLIFSEKVNLTVENIKEYFKNKGVTQCLSLLVDEMLNASEISTSKNETLKEIITGILISTEVSDKEKISISKLFQFSDHIAIPEKQSDEVMESYISADLFEPSSANYGLLKVREGNLHLNFLEKYIDEWKELLSAGITSSDLIDMLSFELKRPIMYQIINEYSESIDFDVLSKETSNQLLGVLSIESNFGLSWKHSFIDSVSKCKADESLKLKFISGFGINDNNMDWYLNFLRQSSLSYSLILNKENNYRAFHELLDTSYNNKIMKNLIKLKKIKSYKVVNGYYHIWK